MNKGYGNGDDYGYGRTRQKRDDYADQRTSEAPVRRTGVTRRIDAELPVDAGKPNRRQEHDDVPVEEDDDRH